MPDPSTQEPSEAMSRVIGGSAKEAAFEVGDTSSGPTQGLRDAVAAHKAATRPTGDAAELVERLRRTEWVCTRERGGEFPVNPDGPQAADLITRQQEQIGRLEGAGKRLSLAAQTTGGTAGRDEELVAAIDQMSAALNGGSNE
jgi:hypothetical protein